MTGTGGTTEYDSVLERAAAAVLAGTIARSALVDALQLADVYVPLLKEPAGENRELLLADLLGSDGDRCIPLFSSRERLERPTRGGTPYLVAPFADVFAAWPAGARALLNPGSEIEVAVSHEELERRNVDRVDMSVRCYMRRPAGDSHDALARVGDVCSTLPQVSSAYRAEVCILGSAEVSHLAIGLVCDSMLPANAARRIALACAEAGVAPVAVLVIDASAPPPGPIAQFMITRTAPFFLAD